LTIPTFTTGIYRWVQKFTPQLEAFFGKGKKRLVGKKLADGRDMHQDQ
jgi:transposase-like protein